MTERLRSIHQPPPEHPSEKDSNGLEHWPLPQETEDRLQRILTSSILNHRDVIQIIVNLKPQYHKAAISKLISIEPQLLNDFLYYQWQKLSGLDQELASLIIKLQKKRIVYQFFLAAKIEIFDRSAHRLIFEHYLRYPGNKEEGLASILDKLGMLNLDQQEVLSQLIQAGHYLIGAFHIHLFKNLSTDTFWELFDGLIKEYDNKNPESNSAITALINNLHLFTDFKGHNQLAHQLVSKNLLPILAYNVDKFQGLDSQIAQNILDGAKKQVKDPLPGLMRSRGIDHVLTCLYHIDNFINPDFEYFFEAWKAATDISPDNRLKTCFVLMVKQVDKFDSPNLAQLIQYAENSYDPIYKMAILLEIRQFRKAGEERLHQLFLDLSESDRQKLINIYLTYERMEELEILFSLLKEDEIQHYFTLNSLEIGKIVKKFLTGNRPTDASALIRIAKLSNRLPEDIEEDTSEYRLSQERIQYHPSRQRPIIGDEIVKFYVYEGLLTDIEVYKHSLGKVEFDQAEKLSRPPQEPSFKVSLNVEEIQQHLDTQINKIFEWIRQYLISAIYSELRHQSDSAYHEDDIFGWPLVVSLPTSDKENGEHPVDAFLRQGTREQLNKFLDEAEIRFSRDGWYDEYGGIEWAKIAHAARQMWAQDLSLSDKTRLIDLSFDLQHHSGMIFDKRDDWVSETDYDFVILGIKRDAPNVDSLITESKPYISPKVHSQLSQSYSVLSDQIEKIKKRPTRTKLGGG